MKWKWGGGKGGKEQKNVFGNNGVQNGYKSKPQRCSLYKLILPGIGAFCLVWILTSFALPAAVSPGSSHGTSHNGNALSNKESGRKHQMKAKPRKPKKYIAPVDPNYCEKFNSRPISAMGEEETSEILMNDEGIFLERGPQLPGTPITNNETISGHVRWHDYDYYQLCVSNHHGHHHRVDVRLCPFKFKDANLYISNTKFNPRSDDSTWLSAHIGDDHVTINTYSEDFQRGGAQNLYIGVRGVSEGKTEYELTVKITDIDNREVLHRQALRGGQSLLPRDVRQH